PSRTRRPTSSRTSTPWACATWWSTVCPCCATASTPAPLPAAPSRDRACAGPPPPGRTRVPRLALTGAGGFVGRHVISAATAEGWEVAGLVRSAESARTVTYSGGAPVMVPALAADAMAPAFAGAAAVVHLAQIGSEKKGETYDAVN